jgi:hypothetical protein
MNLPKDLLISNNLRKGGSGEQIAAFCGPWNLSPIEAEREFALGRFMRAAAMMHAGMFLSHPPMAGAK